MGLLQVGQGLLLPRSGWEISNQVRQCGQLKSSAPLGTNAVMASLFYIFQMKEIDAPTCITNDNRKSIR
jgi:hypothetical protein